MATKLLEIKPIFAWIALVGSIPCYLVIYVYLDSVVPNAYGISKPCCFCLRKRKQIDSGVEKNGDRESNDYPVSIQGLSKQFGTF